MVLILYSPSVCSENVIFPPSPASADDDDNDKVSFFPYYYYYYDVVNDTTTKELSGILSDTQKHIYIDTGTNQRTNQPSCKFLLDKKNCDLIKSEFLRASDVFL